MTIFITSIIISLIIAIVFAFSEWNCGKDILDIIGAFFGSGISLFAILMFAWFVFTAFSDVELERYVYSKIPLVSIQDNPAQKGTYFLGTGTFDGTMKYVYYYKINQETYKMGMCDYSYAIIKYDSIKQIVVYKDRPKNNSHNKHLMFKLYSDNTEYEIHVPNGTIKQDFKLDAK